MPAVKNRKLELQDAVELETTSGEGAARSLASQIGDSNVEARVIPGVRYNSIRHVENNRHSVAMACGGIKVAPFPAIGIN